MQSELTKMIDELERLEKLASPGPWNVLDDGAESCVYAADGSVHWGCHTPGYMELKDAALIAAARNVLPTLLTRLRAAQSLVERWRAEAKQTKEYRDTSTSGPAYGRCTGEIRKCEEHADALAAALEGRR